MATNLHTTTGHVTVNAGTTAAMRTVVAVALAAACVMALAHTRVVAPATAAPARELGDVDLERLERIFWACDHRATTRGVDGAAGMACGIATEQLKQRKFNGDFAAMLAWWRENKTAAHQALARHVRQAELQAEQLAAEDAELPMP